MRLSPAASLYEYARPRGGPRGREGGAGVRRFRWLVWVALASLALGLGAACAQPRGVPAPLGQGDLDTVWTLVAAFLVFFMAAGFALLEAGFCRAKNTVHGLARSFVSLAVVSLAFWVLGFGLMWGRGDALIGASGFLVSGRFSDPAALGGFGVPLFVRFFLYLAYCGVATSIVSGGVAERVRLPAYLLFTALVAAVLYPIVGRAVWNGGVLYALGFRDYAGATVVHSVGGWAALAGALTLGPRIGKYRKDGATSPMPGHNVSLATLGGFILWLGWFGFCAGRTMTADGERIAHVVMTTNLSAAASTLAAVSLAWAVLGKPDFGMTINGTLGGLVAITASCAYVSPGGAIAIGAIAGALVVGGILGFDRLRIDDPVGVLSVHLLNGVFGTLAVGLLASPAAPLREDSPGPGLLYGGGLGSLLTQGLGVLAVGAFVFVVSLAVWQLLRVTLGLRVGPAEELQGLDVTEMGMEAYPHDPSSAALR